MVPVGSQRAEVADLAAIRPVELEVHARTLDDEIVGLVHELPAEHLDRVPGALHLPGGRVDAGDAHLGGERVQLRADQRVNPQQAGTQVKGLGQGRLQLPSLVSGQQTGHTFRVSLDDGVYEGPDRLLRLW